jgi:hypothetical protein
MDQEAIHLYMTQGNNINILHQISALNIQDDSNKRINIKIWYPQTPYETVAMNKPGRISLQKRIIEKYQNGVKYNPINRNQTHT